MAVLHHWLFIRYLLHWNVVSHVWWQQFIFDNVYVPFLFLLFVAGFWSAGRGAFLAVFGRSADGGQGIVCYLAFGMGIYDLLFRLLAAAGLLRTPVIVIVLLVNIVLLLLGRKTLAPALHDGKTLLPVGPLEQSMFVLTAAALCLGVIKALSPPTSWDALAYHLPVPQLYALHHRAFLVPWLVEKQCSIGLEMLSAAGLSLGSDLLPQLFSLLTEMLFLGAVLAFAKKYFTSAVAWVSTALMAVMPVSLYLSGTVTNDFAVALYAFLALWFTGEFLSEKNERYLFVSAVFIALSVQAKMTGLITLSWLILSVVAGVLFFKARIRPAALLVIGGILLFLGSAGFVRNYLWTGNPLFPYFCNYLGSRVLDPAVLDKVAISDRLTTGVPCTLVNFILLPWHLIVSSHRFQSDPRYFVLPAFIISAVRFLYTRKYSSREIFLALYAVYFVAVWFLFGRHLWRFLLPVLPFMAILVVHWLSEIPSTAVKTALSMLLCVSLLPFLSADVNNNLFAVTCLPSMQDPSKSPRERYLEKTLNYYAVYRYMNEHLPDDSRTLILRDVRGYYLQKPYLWGSPCSQSEIVYGDLPDADALRKHLAHLGITHLVLNDLYPPEEEKVMRLVDGVVARYGRKVYEANRTVLYELE
jgi:hypothetical protein